MNIQACSTKLKSVLKIIYLIAPIAVAVWFVFSCQAFYTSFLKLGGISSYSGYIVSLLFSYLLTGIIAGSQAQNKPVEKALVLGVSSAIIGVAPYIVVASVVNKYTDDIQMLYFLASFAVGFSTVVEGLLLTLLYYLAIKKSTTRFAKLGSIIVIIVMLLMTISGALTVYQNNPYASNSHKIYRALHGLGGYSTSNADIKYSFAYATDKITRSEMLPEYEQFDIKLAKNEWESLQLIVAASIDTSITIEVTPFTNASGESLATTIALEHYLDLPLPGNGIHYQYPDGLIPITKDTDISLEKDMLQAFFIETRSLEDTTAGEYTASVIVRDGDGIVLEKNISATVWDFALPKTHYSSTAVGLDTRSSLHELGIETPTFYNDNEDNMVLGYGYNTWKYFYDGTINLADYPEIEELYKASYDYLLEHGLCANFLPYDLLDQRTDEEGILLVDKYLDDPRVTTFCIPYPRDDDEKLVAYFEKATSNPEWAEKAYFYPVDEPMDIYRKESYDAIVSRLNRLLGEGNYNMITPMCEMVSTDWYTGAPIYQFEMQKEDNSWICPQTYFYYNQEYVSEITRLVAEEGKMAWWYVCNGPREEDGYCNLFVQQESIKHRILFWQQFDYDVDGFLYYFANVWTERGTKNPWNTNDLLTTAISGYGISPSGDGTLIYPGVDIGTPGVPAATIRLKNITAGLEDYDYLTMAEAKLGRAAVDNIVDKVTSHLTSYTTDHEVLEAVRREVGDALAAK